MADLVIAVAARVSETLVAPIPRHLGYPFNYRSNILSLTEQLERLDDERQRVQQSVDEANRQGDRIFPSVEKWLSLAEEIIKETYAFLEDERDANRGCFNLILRYQKSKKASGQAWDILEKIKESKFGTVAHRPPPIGSSEFGSSSVSGYEIIEARGKTLNSVMEALRDDSIRKIGVWGMGGVGKTTLVQQVAELARVAKQANEENLFDIVVMALNISQTPNVTKIQGEIASMLGLKLEERDETERAVRLSQSLKKHKKILVILDDIWEPIAFKRIGIPYGSDDHKVGYCKVLLTSRERHVLSKDMGTHKDFHVQHLTEEEAWSLFKNTAGDYVETPELQPIAVDVVKKCEGLPVAIVTIAKALMGESVAVWSDALQKLSRSSPTNIRGVSKNVYSCLELSYNHLESEEVRSLFLLCGLLCGGDISLDDLLKYGMGLDLFYNIDSLEQARNRLVSLVKILIASSLLLDPSEDGCYYGSPSLIFVEEGDGFVRMHDVVRDFAKSIASKYPLHQIVVNELSQEGEKSVAGLRNRTGMSLKRTDVNLLSKGSVCLECPFILLDGIHYSLKNQDTSFKAEVRVLSLFGNHFLQLSSSIHSFSNLRALCLHGEEIEDIRILGNLWRLQILSLFDCFIRKGPEEMMEFTDLRMLIMRDTIFAYTEKLMMSNLPRLEHLCIRVSGEKFPLFYGLKHLSCLSTLELVIPFSCLLLESISFENLTRYDICICNSPGDWYDDRPKTSRSLLLCESWHERNKRKMGLHDVVKFPHLLKCFSKLLKTVEVLQFEELDDAKHFVNELECNGFPKLKYLSIFRSDAIQYIINTIERKWVYPQQSAFPCLVELNLGSLNQLVAVCRGPIPMRCFANLRVLIIKKCNSLKYIFWIPTTQGGELVSFPQLVTLKMEYLPNFINFFSTGTSGSQEPCSSFFNQVALPMLEFLDLNSLENVRTVWDNQDPVGSLGILKDLYLKGCKNLLTVFPSNFLEGIQSLRTLKIEDCCSLKEIFEVGEINRVESVDIAVPPLREMSLHGQNMEIVRKEDSGGYLAFENLSALYVSGCTSLKCIFPASVVKGLMHLKVLGISDCGVEEIVANENGVEVVHLFLFPRLTSLELDGLCQLKRFCQGKYTLGCPLLKNMVVRNCDKVELLFQEDGLEGELDKQPLFLIEKNTFPDVEKLQLGSNGLMEIWRGQFSRESFGKLRLLEIEDWHDISIALSCSELPVLQNLEQLHVSLCSSLEEVIQMEGVVREKIPLLSNISLRGLPMLTHLSGLQSILKNLHSLHVVDCANLINLVSPSMVEEIVGDDGSEATEDICFTNLKELELWDLVKLESFFSSSNTFKFPSLEEVEIRKLPRLTHLYKIIPGGDQGLRKLRILRVFSCKNLEILLTPSMARTLVQLEKLIVCNCDKLKAIVENEGGEAMDEIEIVNDKLQELQLDNLPNLKSFCLARYTFRFPSLTDMEIMECPQMEFFCKGKLMTQRLEKVHMDYEWLVLENDLNTSIQEFMKRHSKEEVPDEEDAEKGDSEEQHPKVEDTVEEDTKEEDSGGGSGSLG